MLVYIDHPDFGPQDTFLTAAVAASATSCTVANAKSFATSDYVVFGQKGVERTEIVLLTGVTQPTTLSHSTGPVFAHDTDTPISQILYNQVKLYSSATETGSYSLVATLDLTLDELQTVYNHSAGTKDTWYKWKYCNGATLSDFSPAMQGVEYTEDSLYYMENAVLEELGDKNADEISRTMVKRWIRAGVRYLCLKIAKLNLNILTAYDTQTLSAGTALYDLQERFIKFKKIEVTYSGNSARRAHLNRTESFATPLTTFSNSEPYISRRGSQWFLRPSTDGGTAAMWFDRFPTPVDDSTDEHGLPYGAADVIILYALYRGWKFTGNETRYRSYRNDLTDAADDYITQLSEDFQGYELPVVRTESDSGEFEEGD